MLDIFPLSADGYLTPASGTVEVELFRAAAAVVHHAPLSGGDTLERVERWTRVVTVADFGVNGARLKLPFGAVHPEFDLDWTPWAWSTCGWSFRATACSTTRSTVCEFGRMHRCGIGTK